MTVRRCIKALHIEAAITFWFVYLSVDLLAIFGLQACSEKVTHLATMLSFVTDSVIFITKKNPKNV